MGIKLLLADDSITIQKVVGIIFASEDYDVTIVDNGNAALSKAREIGPDLLLVDAVMPGRSGYEVCEEIRNDPVLQRVPILLLTGAFEAFDEEKAKKCGADDFISKPFESQNLIDKVTSLLEAGKQRQVSSTPPGPAVLVSPPVPPPMQPVPPVQQPSEALPGAPPARPETGVKDAPAGDSQFSVEVVEGTPDDDLWGAFELEEIGEDQPDAFVDTSAGEEEQFVTEAIEEPFSFAEEPAMPVQPAEPTGAWEISTATAGFEEETDEFAVVPEEDFGIFEEEGGASAPVTPVEFDPFVEETPQAVSPTPPEEGFDFFEEEPKNFFEADPAEFFEEPAVPPAGRQEQLPAGAGTELQFAPDEQYVPIPEATGTGFAAATSPAVPGELTLNEEQLASLVSRISRDILEKIAWEVVPDLAESIIREEIRKIKEGL